VGLNIMGGQVPLMIDRGDFAAVRFSGRATRRWTSETGFHPKCGSLRILWRSGRVEALKVGHLKYPIRRLVPQSAWVSARKELQLVRWL